MNRRKFLKTASAAPAAGAVALAAPAANATLATRIVRLNLRHTWTTTMSSSAYRDTLHTTFVRGGITGHGEGAPIVRYHEDAVSAQKAVESVRDLLYFGASEKKITHTGIYMGDGKFINATTHLTPMVRIDDLNDAYWSKLLVAARRLK